MSEGTRNKRTVRVFMALSLMFSVIATIPFVSSAVATADGTVTGRLWVDLDNDSVDDGDTSVLAPFGVVGGFGTEPGAEGINIRLLSETGDEVATTISNADGSYAFATQPDGTYELEFEAPVGFDFSSTAPEGDHFATSDPAPLPGFSQFARMPVVIDGADVVAGTVGLRPTAALDISWVDVDPDAEGVQAIATGTEPFTSCVNGVAAAGEDCSPEDNIVRTNDITSYTVSVSGDNIDPSLNPLPEVILEQHITPVDGAVIAFDVDSVLGVPPGCLTEGVTKPSSVTLHDDGSSTLICNIGDFDTAEVNFLTTNVVVSGDSPPGSSFTFAARGFAGLVNAVASPILDAPAVIVSASPRFDLTMNRDDSNTRNRVFEQGQLTSMINPVTGETELGKVFYYDVSLLADGDGVGTSALGEEITFTNIIDPVLAEHGASLLSCQAGPFNEDGAASLPGNGQGAPYGEDRVADNGAWACDYNPDTQAIDIVVTGADTSAKHLPSRGADGTPLPELDVVLTGNVKVWYPLSAFMRSADPNWTQDDPIIPGSYPIYNCVGDFDPDSGLGAGSNYGDGVEPGYGETDYDPEPFGNNCRFHNFQIAEPGSFFLRYGGNDRLDLGVGEELWPCVGDPDQAIVPRQTQCDSGDGPVAGGQNYYIEVAGRNQEGVLPVKDQWLCGVIDNSIATIRPIENGPSAGSWGFAQERTIADGFIAADPAEWTVEFARFTAAAGQTTWQVDHDVTGSLNSTGMRAIDVTQMKAAAADCGQARTASGELQWSTDPAADGWSTDSIVLVRSRPIGDAVVGAGEDLVLYIPMAARTQYFGDAGQPDAGEYILPGSIVPVLGNHRAFGEFGTGGYDPVGHGGIDGATTVQFGDRLIFEEVRLTIDMRAHRETSAIGADDLAAVPAGERIWWTVHPAVTDAAGEGVAAEVTVTVDLPKWAVYDPSCSAATPAGVGGPIIAPNPVSGETTFTWYFGDRQANVALPALEVCAVADPFSPAPLDLVADTLIDAENNNTGPEDRTDTRTVRVTQKGGVAVFKTVDQSYDFPGDDQIWSLRWGNLSQRVVVSPIDIIDVLPYNGDGVTALSGREFADSEFSGDLHLAAIPAVPFVSPIDGGVAVPDVGTWLVTGADPATISHDPLAASNDLVNNISGWCDSDDLVACGLSLTDITAIRWVSDLNVAPRTVVQADVVLVAGPGSTNTAGDQYVNRFTAYTETFPTLSVRSNEPWVQIVAFSLGDRLFGDANNNGTFDEGIDLNVGAGITVELYDRFDRLVATTETDDEGRWLFSELDPGSYYVVLPADLFDGGDLDGWSAATAGFHADPNADEDDDVDHHATADLIRSGAVRSSGLIVLSAQRDAAGLIIGDEPMGDGSGLEDPTSRDDLTNMGLDLALTPAIEIDVEGAINAVDRLAPTADEDSDTAPGRRVAAETAQRFSYLVTNPGQIGLTDIVVVDNNASTTNRDDWEAEPVVREGTNIGDTNRDGVLDPGEEWLFVPPASADVTPAAGAYVATIAAKGLPVGGGSAVEDRDTTAYVAAAPATLTIEMATIPANPSTPTVAEDADRAPGLTVLEGTEIWWSYLVSTDDPAGLTDVYVVDDSGTNGDPGDDFKAEPVTDRDGTNIGDRDRDGVLDAGEVWQFRSPAEETIKAEIGTYKGIAVAYGTSASVITSEGTASGGVEVAAKDLSHHNAGEAGIGLESYLVGTQVETPQDADEAPGPGFTVGVEIGWRYVVTNPGALPLENVIVVSDNGTPNDPTDDITMTGRPTTGDADNDGQLDPGEQWVYGRSGTPDAAAEVTEIARVTSKAVIPVVIGSQSVPTPSASDPTNYVVAPEAPPQGSVRLDKDVCLSTKNKECQVDDDADWTDTVSRPAAQKALWRITVTNDGEVPLRQVRVTDDKVRSCSRVINHLEPGDSESWRCVSGNVKDTLVNVAVVNALPECEADDFFGVGNFNGNGGPAELDRPGQDDEKASNGNGNGNNRAADDSATAEGDGLDAADERGAEISPAAIEAQEKPYSEREPIRITEVVMTHDGRTITQTSPASSVINKDSKPVDMVSITINDNGIEMTLDTTEVVGADVSNIKFPSGLKGVRTLENGQRTEVGAAGFESAVERVLTSSDIRDYLAYDGLNPKATNWAEDFDFVFDQPMRNDDYMIVFERNGNTFFELTPLDENGEKIAGATAVEFDKPYAWNTGYAPSDLASQPMWFSVVDIEAFGIDTSETPIWGFEINNDGQADVKFFTFEGDLVDEDDEDEGIGDDDDIDIDPDDDADDDGQDDGDDDGEDIPAECEPVRHTAEASVIVGADDIPGNRLNSNNPNLAFIDNGDGTFSETGDDGNNGKGNSRIPLPSPSNPAAVAGSAAVACAGAAAAAAGGGGSAAASAADKCAKGAKKCIEGAAKVAKACMSFFR